jgi:hypothetical protein
MRATTRRRLERIGWFVALYVASLAVVGAVAYGLRWLIVPA